MQQMQQAITKKRSLFTTRMMVQVSILSAIAYGLMFISAPIPGIFPEFLKIDLSDIPAIFGGLAFGPVAGFVVVFVKNFLQMLTATTTGGVGEFANIVIGGSYVFVACYIYKRNKSLKGLILGFAAGTVAMIIVGSIVNYFIMIPFYGKLMSMDAILGMGKAINPKADTLLGFVLWFIAPFNLVKGAVLSVLSIPLYKKLAKVLHR